MKKKSSIPGTLNTDDACCGSVYSELVMQEIAGLNLSWVRNNKDCFPVEPRQKSLQNSILTLNSLVDAMRKSGWVPSE